MTTPVMDKTIGIISREPLDRTSLKYPDTDYGGTVRAAKSLMLEFLKECYQNLPDDNPFKFSEDQKFSRINIVDKLSFNLEEVDKRPAIVVHRRGLVYNKMGVNQRYAQNRLEKKEGDESKLDGATHRTGLLRGELMLQCYGKGQTLQAEFLGESVFELITNMEDALKRIGFFECHANAIGEEIPILKGSKTRLIMVPVSVQYSMQKSWKLTTEYMRKLSAIEEKIT